MDWNEEDVPQEWLLLGALGLQSSTYPTNPLPCWYPYASRIIWDPPEPLPGRGVRAWPLGLGRKEFHDFLFPLFVSVCLFPAEPQA